VYGISVNYVVFALSGKARQAKYIGVNVGLFSSSKSLACRLAPHDPSTPTEASADRATILSQSSQNVKMGMV